MKFTQRWDKKEIYHSGNKGNVCKNLAKNSNSKGLVDEDPFSTQPSYIGKLELISHEHDIKLLYDEKAQNQLIVLCPKLEDWILKAAKEAKVNVEDIGLPDDAYSLHEIININLGKFILLIEDIKKKRSKMLQSLETLLKTRNQRSNYRRNKSLNKCSQKKQWHDYSKIKPNSLFQLKFYFSFLFSQRKIHHMPQP